MAKSEKQVAQKRWWEMVEVGRFVDELRAAGIGLLIGVPDSLLKSLCAYVTDTCGENRREKIGLTCFIKCFIKCGVHSILYFGLAIG